MQAPELQHDEEPEEVVRAPRNEQVLPVLPEAHGAQGDEVGFGLQVPDCGPVTRDARAALEPEAWSQKPGARFVER